MTLSDLGTTSDVSLSAEDRVDLACDEFEAAWKTGERPIIEKWLAADQPRHERLTLLGELLSIELFWRTKSGERPDPSEYIDRFPERDESIEVARTFARASTLHRRFTPHELHARGGLGAVYKAHDEELNREVALKKIREERSHDPQSQARFLREAEITGQLEHPGIVPVYSLSRSDDGSPFYAMRFVHGETLQAAITRFHGELSDEAGRDSAEGPSKTSVSRLKRKAPNADASSLAFRQLLLRFIEVCNPIAYAHSRSVLHRDIKPENIMLGPFGEPLVLDWGLTKAVGCTPGAEPADSAPAANSSSGTSDTQPGSRIGTLGYMSPEQAAGEHDRLGPASDVYSLGATLYAILTGQRPLSGESDANEILKKTQAGEIRRPRCVRPTLPRSLEAICVKAMALRPEDRYPSPRTLADDLERWLAGEPVTA
jgi:eukaryotic-like serine/threonine-protein kinase